MMPATVWTLTVSRALKDGRRRAETEGSRERHMGGDVGDATTRRAAQSKNRSGQVTAASVLVEAGILAAEVLEEFGHRLVLVGRAWKVEREAASRKARRDLGEVVTSGADASDEGTCETMAVW